VRVSLCTTVVDNTAQCRTVLIILFSYPPDKHHCSDVVTQLEETEELRREHQTPVSMRDRGQNTTADRPGKGQIPLGTVPRNFILATVKAKFHWDQFLVTSSRRR